ncbi:MAG: Maf family protein [Chloroflexota bacterium]
MRTEPGHRAVPAHLVLASASPRRREILGALGLPFVVRAADVDETPTAGESPAATVCRLAVAKARAVTLEPEERFVIAADTMVVLEGEVLGKPADPAEATTMLCRLRARPHEVISGVAVLDHAGGRLAADALTTRVWMRDYADAEIAAYVASGEPFDKAGAYAIQDPVFRPVARLEGCYLNVVGLPLCLLLSLLWEAGASLDPPDPRQIRRLCPHCLLQPD